MQGCALHRFAWWILFMQGHHLQHFWLHFCAHVSLCCEWYYVFLKKNKGDERNEKKRPQEKGDELPLNMFNVVSKFQCCFCMGSKGLRVVLSFLGRRYT